MFKPKYLVYKTLSSLSLRYAYDHELFENNIISIRSVSESKESASYVNYLYCCKNASLTKINLKCKTFSIQHMKTPFALAVGQVFFSVSIVYNIRLQNLAFRHLIVKVT